MNTTGQFGLKAGLKLDSWPPPCWKRQCIVLWKMWKGKRTDQKQAWINDHTADMPTIWTTIAYSEQSFVATWILQAAETSIHADISPPSTGLTGTGRPSPRPQLTAVGLDDEDDQTDQAVYKCTQAATISNRLQTSAQHGRSGGGNAGPVHTRPHSLLMETAGGPATGRPWWCTGSKVRWSSVTVVHAALRADKHAAVRLRSNAVTNGSARHINVASPCGHYYTSSAQKISQVATRGSEPWHAPTPENQRSSLILTIWLAVWRTGYW